MKRKRDTRRWIDGQFIPRTIEMLGSPAMRVLSLTAHRILIRLEIELAEHGGRENGRLPVTYADLAEFGVGNRSLIAPAIRELCALGFLELTKPGRSGNGAYRAPNQFRLTYLPTGRKAPTHEWRRVNTSGEAEQIARNARASKNARPKQKNASAGFRTSPGPKTVPPPVPVFGTRPRFRQCRK